MLEHAETIISILSGCLVVSEGLSLTKGAKSNGNIQLGFNVLKAIVGVFRKEKSILGK